MQDPRLSALFDRYRRQGDLSALAKVFDDLSPEMMRVARHVAGRGVDPEDVVQSTFLAAIERAESFDAGRPLVPWLMGILINQARLANRRRATRHEEAAAEDIESDGAVAEDAEAREVRDAVARALADLPETYREVLALHLSEGKKPHEIAAELGRPQGTVRAQLFRGLRIVRGALPSGFALGALALLDRSALAGVRRTVLLEAARARGLGPQAAASVAGAPVRIHSLAAVAGAAAVLLAVLALAWGVGSGGDLDVDPPSPHAPAIADGSSSESGRREPVGVRPSGSASSDAAGTAPGEAFGALLVRVRDARGEPALGVRVDVLPWGDPEWHARTLTTTTLADGTASVTRLHPGRVGVHLDAGQQERTDIVAGTVTELALQLPAGLAVEGLVLDERGAPAEGAVVEAFGTGDVAPRRSAQPTGADGRFRLDDVSRTCSVGAHAEGRAPSQLVWLGVPAWREAAGAQVVLSLGPYVPACEVEVVGARGQPLPGATVETHRAAPTGQPAGRFRGDGTVEIGASPLRATTDAHGRARIFPARDEGGRLTVRAEGHAPAELEVPARHALVELRRGATISGRVLYASGAPAEGALVAVLPAGWTRAIEIRAGAGGAWSLATVPAGEVELRVRASPEAPVATRTALLADEGTFEWDARVEPAAVIRGTAYTVKGVPSRVALVQAVREGGASGWSLLDWAAAHAPFDSARQMRQCWTGNDGSFAVPCEPGASYRLELRPRGAWLGAVMGTREAVAAGASGVELRARPGRAWIRGHVADASGRAMSATLLALRPGSSGDQRIRTEAHSGGDFAFDLAPGTYELLAWPDGGLPRSVGRREVLDDEAWELDAIVVPVPGSVRVEGAFGREIGLTSADGLPLALAREGGDLVARGLPPGTYVLRRGAETESIAVRSGQVTEIGAQNVVRSVK